MNLLKVPKTSLVNSAYKSKRLVAWMVSNCYTASHREHYVLELQKHIPIDVYGNCENVVNAESTPMSCPKNLEDKCWNMIDETYKVSLICCLQIEVQV